MNVYLIESCDADEGQIFWDVIPAETPEQAVAEWESVRDDYATIIAHYDLEDHIERVLQSVSQLLKFVKNPELAAKAWAKLKKDCGP